MSDNNFFLSNLFYKKHTIVLHDKPQTGKNCLVFPQLPLYYTEVTLTTVLLSASAGTGKKRVQMQMKMRSARETAKMEGCY